MGAAMGAAMDGGGGAVEPPVRVAGHAFGMDDQHRFAALSGDHNPMHMDPVAARRLIAGAPVVHGVQALLWALDALDDDLPLRGLRRIEADFARFLRVGERCELRLAGWNGVGATAELRVDGDRVALYRLGFGNEAAVDGPDREVSESEGGEVFAADEAVPRPLDWDAIAAARGTVLFHRPDPDAAIAYPALAAAIGAGRVAALLALSRLVGMVSPGLHSTFHRIDARLVPPGNGGGGERPNRLRFRTVQAEPRFGVVTMAVAAEGLRGRVRASRREPPRAQPGMAELAGTVAPDRFRGHRALVVGGSRGIGEVCAKLLALGGADTVIGYAVGRDDAEAVAADIRRAGGRAHAARLDVREPLAAQLDALPAAVGSAYFFATPRIGSKAGGRNGTGFSPELFERYRRIYVDAFGELCAHLAGAGAGSGRTRAVFYPSSVFVSEPPPELIEYAMAKAAGEVLAAGLARAHPRLRVEVARLPRLPTDQTAGLAEHELPSIASCMAPLVERVEQRTMPA